MLAPKNRCTGCAACANICPVKAIEMSADKVIEEVLEGISVILPVLSMLIIAGDKLKFAGLTVADAAKTFKHANETASIKINEKSKIFSFFILYL